MKSFIAKTEGEPDAPASGSNIFSSGRWVAASQAGTQIIRTSVALVLARLLEPGDFGLMAMAIVILGFTELFKDLGIVPAIVQRKAIADGLLGSLFWFSLLLGLLASVAVVASSPILVLLYDDPRLYSIIAILAWTLSISSIGMVKKALLQRSMRFDRIARVELGAACLQGGTAIVLGFLGWKVWALVAGAIVGSVASSVLYWLYCSWRPPLHFRWSEVRSVFGFSLNLTASQVFGYFVSHADNVLIGRFLGATPLGFYAMVQRLFMMPVAFLTSVAGRVLFPALSSIQDDNRRVGQMYLRACGLIAFGTFPLLAGAAAVAEPLVLVALGEKWRSVGILIWILAPAFLIRSLASTVSVIYMAKGRTDIQLRWQIVAGVTFLLGVTCGIAWDLVGVAVGYTLSMVILSYHAFAIPFRLINLPFGELVLVLRPYAVSTGMMLVMVLAARLAISRLAASPVIELSVGVLVGAATYAGMLALLAPPALADLGRIVRPMFARKARTDSAAGSCHPPK